MSVRLNDESIDKIVLVLDGWSGTFTWDLFADAIAVRLGVRYSRQALERHVRIKKGFQLTKKRLREAKPAIRSGIVEVEKLQEQLDRLKAKATRLEAENSSLLDQFRRWAYNASIAGFTQEKLNTPLPEVDRKHAK